MIHPLILTPPPPPLACGVEINVGPRDNYSIGSLFESLKVHYENAYTFLFDYFYPGLLIDPENPQLPLPTTFLLAFKTRDEYRWGSCNVTRKSAIKQTNLIIVWLLIHFWVCDEKLTPQTKCVVRNSSFCWPFPSPESKWFFSIELCLNSWDYLLGIFISVTVVCLLFRATHKVVKVSHYRKCI